MTAQQSAALLEYAAARWGTAPERPWLRRPEVLALRHTDSRRCYALFYTLPRQRLGLPGGDAAALLELKCHPALAGSLRGQPGVFPPQHMRRDGWLALLLDGSVPADQLRFLLEQSFVRTASSRERALDRSMGPRIWLVPANPKYFDLEAAFEQADTVLWKQSSPVAVGDTVYMYLAAPVSAIRYRCQALEVDIPCQDDGPLHVRRLMRLRLDHRYDPACFPLARLQALGVRTVRGPRGVPPALLEALEAAEHGA